MGRVNYGPFIFDRKVKVIMMMLLLKFDCNWLISSQLVQGILSSVYLDGNRVQGWKMFPIPLHNLNEVPTYNPITQASDSAFSVISASRKRLMYKSGMC